MKIITLGSALAVALTSTFAISSPAMARDNAAAEQTGHYEWRNAPTYGPRAIPRRVRVWVGQPQMAANCDCSMITVGQSEVAACMGMPQSNQSRPNG